MCNAANHPPSCTCGFGGDGHLGRISHKAFAKNSLEKTPFFGQYSSFLNPNAKCPECGQNVFYYENSYGSKVWFDDIGPPWPKHHCLDDLSIIGNTLEWRKEWSPIKVLNTFTISKNELVLFGTELKSGEGVSCLIPDLGGLKRELESSDLIFLSPSKEKLTFLSEDIKTFEITIQTEFKMEVLSTRVKGKVNLKPLNAALNLKCVAHRRFMRQESLSQVNSNTLKVALCKIDGVDVNSKSILFKEIVSSLL